MEQLLTKSNNLASNEEAAEVGVAIADSDWVIHLLETMHLPRGDVTDGDGGMRAHGLRKYLLQKKLKRKNLNLKMKLKMKMKMKKMKKKWRILRMFKILRI
jgi:dephospho-CoA kinase